jgi:nitrile hydratase subunit beta
MDGIHDMGGVQGYGTMPSHEDERPFHHSWEPFGYIVAILAAERGFWTFDAGRHVIERIPQRQYMNMPYYDRVLMGMVSNCIEHGLVTQEEIEKAAAGPIPVSLPLGPAQDARVNHPGFQVGDRVVVRTLPPTGHTRAPRYIHGRTGVILRQAPHASFPGQAGHRLPAAIEPTYHVEFKASDLWGEAEVGASVVVDVFQSYLDRA